MSSHHESRAGEVPPHERTLPWWVRPFVLFHLLAITVWTLPPPAPGIANGSLSPSIDTDSPGDIVRTLVPFIHDELLLSAYRIKEPGEGNPSLASRAVRGYLDWTGLWQYWDMFAPNPSNLDLWVDAEVTFQDGTRRVQTYPRMANLPIPQKYAMERFRKFLERANAEAFDFLWAPFAQHMALEAFADPDNPPVRVVLIRHFRYIQPPSKPTPEAYTAVRYFEYDVDQTALRAAAGAR